VRIGFGVESRSPIQTGERQGAAHLLWDGQMGKVMEWVGDETALGQRGCSKGSQRSPFRQRCAPVAGRESKGDKTPPGLFFLTSDRCVAVITGSRRVRARIFRSDSSGARASWLTRPAILIGKGGVRRGQWIIRSRRRQSRTTAQSGHMAAVGWLTEMREGHSGVFAFSIAKVSQGDRAAADGSAARFCHQIEKTGLGDGTRPLLGRRDRDPVQNNYGPSYGPFDIDKGLPDRDALLDGDIPPDQGRPYARMRVSAGVAIRYTPALWAEG